MTTGADGEGVSEAVDAEAGGAVDGVFAGESGKRRRSKVARMVRAGEAMAMDGREGKSMLNESDE